MLILIKVNAHTHKNSKIRCFILSCGNPVIEGWHKTRIPVQLFFFFYVQLKSKEKLMLKPCC